MPRDLADVLHYFLPEVDSGSDPSPGTTDAPGESAKTPPSARRAGEAARSGPDGAGTGAEGDEAPPAPPPRPGAPALPVLGLPMREGDGLRVGLTWNLAIETARLGARVALVVPESDRAPSLWPEAGIGPLGVELLYAPAKDTSGLIDAAERIAHARAAQAPRGGLVVVRLPEEELAADTPLPSRLRWLLLFSRSEPEALRRTSRLAGRLFDRHPGLEIAVSLHGVQSIAEAREGYEAMTRSTQAETGRPLISCGLLAEDLEFYRSLAARRPVGLVHPSSPAARSVADVARLLYEDARSRVLG